MTKLTGRRLWTRIAALAIAVCLALLGINVASNRAAETEPAVHVIDGDTLQLDGQVLRLSGIDAPEIGQTCFEGSDPWPCGMTAALALQKLIDLSLPEFRCEVQPAEPLPIAVCEASREDVAEVMLRQGHAIALADSSFDYRNAEQDAKTASLGIWHSKLTLPSDWRANKRLTIHGVSDEDCNVKGIVTEGEKLFYVPLDAGYESLQVVLANGDQIFCSVDQARAQGWRRPGESGG